MLADEAQSGQRRNPGSAIFTRRAAIRTRELRARSEELGDSAILSRRCVLQLGISHTNSEASQYQTA
eukprot:10100784-Alexandrium_andersonii.AAC.1